MTKSISHRRLKSWSSSSKLHYDFRQGVGRSFCQKSRHNLSKRLTLIIDSVLSRWPRVCHYRPLIFEYDQTVSHFGIEGYQYSVDKKTLGNDTRRRYPHEQAKFFEPTTTTEDFFTAEHFSESTRSPITTTESLSSGSSEENSSENTGELPDDDPDVVNMGNCYCNGECTPSGMINVTMCRFGAPVFISLPHFYKADPSLLDHIEGLNPNDTQHSFSITLEPVSDWCMTIGDERERVCAR